MNKKDTPSVKITTTVVPKVSGNPDQHPFFMDQPDTGQLILDHALENQAQARASLDETIVLEPVQSARPFVAPDTLEVTPLPTFVDPSVNRALGTVGPIAPNDTTSNEMRVTTAFLVMLDENNFMLVIGTLFGQAWVCTMSMSADDTLLDNGWRRDSPWEWLNSFLTCSIVRDV